MTPFYAHLPGVPGFGVHSNIDRIGLGATAAVAAAFTAQGVAKLVQQRVARSSAADESNEEGGSQS
jgi:Ni,Fe-hydrogenase I small subunit